MKALFNIRLFLIAAILLSATPFLEARDKPKPRGEYSSDRARDIRNAQAKESKRREEAYRDRRDDRRHYYGRGYRSGYNYYPGYGYGGYNSGYYYGRPRTSIAIGVAPFYSTQYIERERPVYRGQEVSEGGSSSLEVEVQKKLGRLGYYSGSYDGDIGPASRRAILKYQSDNDLPETGRIDRSLVNSLGLS